MAHRILVPASVCLAAATAALAACAPERTAGSLEEMIDACRRFDGPDAVRAYAARHRLPVVPSAQSHEANLQGSWSGPSGVQLHVQDFPRGSDERQYSGSGCVVTGRTRDAGALIDGVSARSGGVRMFDTIGPRRLNAALGPADLRLLAPIQNLVFTFEQPRPPIAFDRWVATLPPNNRRALAVQAQVKFYSTRLPPFDR